MVKNTLKLVLLLGLTWLVLPTGTTDFLIIPLIIKQIGFKGYIVLCLFLIFILYNNIEGRTLKDKLNEVKRELSSLI